MTTPVASDPTVAAVVKTITLDHALERVWRAITDPAEVVQWFPDEAAEWVAEPGEMGSMTWRDAGVGGTQFTTTLRIETVEEPTYFAWTWGHESTTEPTTLVEFTLVATAAGGTELTVRETGFGTVKHRDGNDEGWGEELAELVAYLDGPTA